MFGLEILAAGGLMMMTSGGQPAFVCPQREAGKVHIIWSSDAVKYDFNQTQSQLDRKEIDTQNPYDRSVKTHVGGLMSGGINVKSSVEVATMTYPRSQVVCQWVQNVNLTIAIDPTIFIAREHPQGSCKHRAILEHEMKHVYVDRDIVKEYAPILKNYLEEAIIKVGIVGPKAEHRSREFHQKIIQYMESRLKDITDRMYAERRKRQQAVDSLQEYQRVSRMCN